MAGYPEIKCVGPSYQLADRKSGVQRSVNLHLQQVEGLGEIRQFVLVSAPGLELLVTFPADVRGTYKTDGLWYVVAGNTLYSLTTAGVYAALGTLATSSGFVSMKHGRDQLVIVDGANGYVFNMLTSVFAQITDPDWRGSDWVDELDGYFIFVDPDTDQFYLSQIDDGSDLDALDFSSADSQPDNIVTHRVRKGELHLIGSRSIEIWINSGDPDFPFTRYNSTPINVGVVGNRAACIAADALVWVGRTDRGAGYVYAMLGHQPQRISTQAVEEGIAQATEISQCVMWTYHEAGNEFVGVSAPGMATTWVYDFSTQQWHERAELLSGDFIPSRIDQVTFVDDAHYGTAGSSVYRIANDVRTLAGDPLPRERTWPHLISPSMEPVSYRGLQLACTTGYGGNITLEISNDGGYVWGPPLPKSLGATGRRMQPVRWLNLGTAIDRVFRLRCTDDVPLTIHGAVVDA